MTITYTVGGTITQQFAPGGAGASITALVGVAVGGSIASMVLSAIGQGFVSNIVKIVSTLTCVAILIGAVTKTLSMLGISL